MFYGQCWKCGERWELGTASACKCPDEEPVKFAFRENNDSTEILRVTPEGEFIWHEDADRMIEEGDFSQSPALPHILKVLRKQRHEQEPVGQLLEDAFGRGQVMWFNKPKDESMLYTTPPQRTWVGLTDEDIWEAYMESPVELDCSTDELYALSRTVEAKLKDKNT